MLVSLQDSASHSPVSPQPLLSPLLQIQSELAAAPHISTQRQPTWVAAAQLQTALQASSSVVPGMHAAAERERRLAAAAALARQQLDLGMTQEAAAAAAGHLPAVLDPHQHYEQLQQQQLQQQQLQQLQQQQHQQQPPDAATSQLLPHLVELTQQVAQQTALLQQAMKQQQEQLCQQQVGLALSGS